MFRGSTPVLLLRADIATAELRRLLPLLQLKAQGATSSTQSVASLLITTAFASTMKHSPAIHSRDCPVYAKSLPLSRVSSDPSFAAHPCASCVRERIHYLASVMFCDDFEQRCRAVDGSPVREKREKVIKPPTTTGLLEKEVNTSFGSFATLKENIQQLSQSAMTPGRLWLVYRPPTKIAAGGSLALLSLPGCKVPLAHGLWPLAVVNISEECVCDELGRRAKGAGRPADGGGDVTPPAWSHAARTPGVAVFAGDAGKGFDGGVMGYVSLSDLQETVANRALDAMNWVFVEKQLASALAYYTSAERVVTRQDHRKEKEQLAAVRAMSLLKDSGAVLHAADSVTISSSHFTNPAPGAEEANASFAAAQVGSTKVVSNVEPSTAGAQDAASAGTLAAAAAAVAQTTSPSYVASTEGAFVADSAHAAAAADPLPVQQPDGTWEYHYANGDVTKVRPDGTKVFQTKELTTTVYANGDTLFEYLNNTSILDRADGVRVTTYADGTTKEERLK